MNLQLAFNESVAHCDQDNLNTFTSCELHGRHEITISGDQDNTLNNLFTG